MNVAVCDYDAGNVRSVAIALARQGASARVTNYPAQVLAADLAVLPGVGSAGTEMASVTASGIGRALCERFDSGRPNLGICLCTHLPVQ